MFFSAVPKTENSVPAPERKRTLSPMQLMYCDEVETVGVFGVVGADELLDELDEPVELCGGGEGCTLSSCTGELCKPLSSCGEENSAP